MVSMFPFIAWIVIILIGLVVYLIVATKIEKSGLERLGATGHLFTCNPEAKKKKKKESSPQKSASPQRGNEEVVRI